MKVQELIDKLQKADPEATVDFRCEYYYDDIDIKSIVLYEGLDTDSGFVTLCDEDSPCLKFCSGVLI